VANSLRQILRDDSCSSEVAHLSSSGSLHQALYHPSIVAMYTAFSNSHAYFQIMELCSRGTLSAFLKSRDPPILQESELRGVIKTLVDALTYLRKERVLHRDIKASNILITDDFRVVGHYTSDDSESFTLSSYLETCRLRSSA
jgi:polo-like kinase 4